MHQPPESDVRGILIYPLNFIEEISEVYEWSEKYYLEIYSLDLNASWHNIRIRLKDILRGDKIKETQ